MEKNWLHYESSGGSVFIHNSDRNYYIHNCDCYDRKQPSRATAIITCKPQFRMILAFRCFKRPVLVWRTSYDSD